MPPIRRATLLAAPLAAALTLPLTAASGGAQELPRLRFGAGVGANVPAGDFGDATSTGIVFQPYVALALLPGLRVRAELHYSRADLDAPLIRRVGDQVLPDGTNLPVTGNVSIVGGSLNLAVGGTPLLGLVRPYAIGGVGWFSLDVAQDIETDLAEFRRLTRDEGDLGWNVGVGARFPLWLITGYVEARYLSIPSGGERTTVVPVVVGVEF